MTNWPLASLVGKLAAALRSAWVISTTSASVEPPLEVSDITREAILELESADQPSWLTPTHNRARSEPMSIFLEIINFLRQVLRNESTRIGMSSRGRNSL